MKLRNKKSTQIRPNNLKKTSSPKNNSGLDFSFFDDDDSTFRYI